MLASHIKAKFQTISSDTTREREREKNSERNNSTALGRSPLFIFFLLHAVHFIVTDKHCTAFICVSIQFVAFYFVRGKARGRLYLFTIETLGILQLIIWNSCSSIKFQYRKNVVCTLHTAHIQMRKITLHNAEIKRKTSPISIIVRMS